MANIDKQLIQTRFARSVATYHEAAKIQRDMAETLLDQLALATGGERRFDRILEAGCGSGMLTDLVETRLEYRKLYLSDLVPEWERFHRGRRAAEFRAADIETMPLPEHLSLVIANAVFQWVEDLASLLIRFHAALDTGGILAFTRQSGYNHLPVSNPAAPQKKPASSLAGHKTVSVLFHPR